jgi:hypothetical protein
MELYYEVGGLEPNSNYTTQLEVKRRGGGGGFLRSIFGGGGKALSLKFTEQAPTPIVRVRRSVQLDRLKPGEYVLQVIVTDAAGHSDRREQPFDVVDK